MSMYMIMNRFQHPKGKKRGVGGEEVNFIGSKVMCLRNPRGKRGRSHKIWKIMGCSYVIILNRASMLYIGDVKKQRGGEKLKGSRLERDGGSKIAKQRQKKYTQTKG